MTRRREGGWMKFTILILKPLSLLRPLVFRGSWHWRLQRALATFSYSFCEKERNEKSEKAQHFLSKPALMPFLTGSDFKPAIETLRAKKQERKTATFFVSWRKIKTRRNSPGSWRGARCRGWPRSAWRRPPSPGRRCCPSHPPPPWRSGWEQPRCSDLSLGT